MNVGTAIGAGWQRAMVVAVCAIAVVFVAGSVWQVLVALAPVLGLFFVGWLLSCVLEPLTAKLELGHMRRPSAIAATYMAVVLAVTLAWIGIGPTLAGQVGATVANSPTLMEAASQRALRDQSLANAWLAERGVPVHLDLASHLSLDSLARQVQTDLDAAALSSLPLLNGAVGVLGSTAMILLLSVFILAGGRQLAEQVEQAFGNRTAADVRFVLTTVHDTFEAFVRAQLVQALVFAAAVWVCLALAQIGGAPVVALTAGVLLLVPVLGSVLALLPPVVATLVWHPDVTLILLAALLLLEQLVLNVLGPRVMSRQLGLPPLLVLFGVLAGAQLGGLWGAVFGVPVLAAVVHCAQHFRPGRTD